VNDAPVAGTCYRFCLFVTGTTARSLRAIENARKLCDENLRGRYELEIVDVYEHPEATRDLQIIATPTLVKLSPAPLRRFIGDLADLDRLLAGLDLTPLNGKSPDWPPS
jgi:circadian clock protein KaiB